MPVSSKTQRIIRQMTDNQHTVTVLVGTTTAIKILRRNERRNYLHLQHTIDTLDAVIGLGFIPTATRFSHHLKGSTTQSNAFIQQGESTFKGPVFVLAITTAFVVSATEGETN